ncbi:predicted protein [Sclerotinia sclerotiorum 1980 UF-70]|uniref:Uncharacterized protein n=1 Tax=Sclerotinia sclerotiorum (strain ATCC 18683 / 1980 / Ss-1) TaxID=665079 RepID=A7EYF7_SCLS1|nr:predicted protein [Sclerotinia sclerotiorum 1980 UF-70]EDN94499.1 predicted protein [Sclerotinia sclerotiorum 1980 UF-70]
MSEISRRVSCRVVLSKVSEQRKRSKRSKTFTECLRYDTASKDSSAAVYTKINPGLWLHWLIGVKKVPRDDSNIPGTQTGAKCGMYDMMIAITIKK